MASARRTWLALGAVTVLGAALRLPFLSLQSLWYDETFTLAVVEQDTLGKLWDQVRLSESTPPLYYAITWVWERLIGSTSDAALRAPAAIAGVLCVPAAYVALRRFVGERAALAAAALTAVSPVLVLYSLNARAYPLLVLLGCLSVWATGEALARRRGRWLAIWALLAAACLWTHYYAGFLIGAELGLLLWRLPGMRLRVAGAAAAVAALFAPLLPLLADQRDERASHIDSLDLGERVEQAVRQLAAGPNPPSLALEVVAVALAAGGIALGGWLALRRAAGAREVALPEAAASPEAAAPPTPALLAIVAAAAVVAPLALAVSGVDDHFFMRNLLVAWVAFAGVAALGLTRLRAIPLGLALAAGLALVVATHADWRHQNADWEGALAKLGPSLEGRPVVVLPGFDAPVANTYLDRKVVTHPLPAQSAWVIVEPGREGRSDLSEQSGYPRAAPPGFRPTVTRTHRGFRMILIEAGAPATLDPGALGPDQLEQRPVALAPP
ncbi:MAG TPA: glycosyltransferase family 39 protein [Thermoleophilaceae bacterium]